MKFTDYSVLTEQMDVAFEVVISPDGQMVEDTDEHHLINDNNGNDNDFENDFEDDAEDNENESKNDDEDKSDREDCDDDDVTHSCDVADEPSTTYVRSSSKRFTARANFPGQANTSPKNRKEVIDDNNHHVHLNHWAIFDMTRACRSRCKNAPCKLFSDWYCIKCQKHFCLKRNNNCFYEHHKDNVDQQSHWAIHDMTKACRSRCKNAPCKLFTDWYCQKCEKHFCLKRNSNCFYKYHHKKQYQT